VKINPLNVFEVRRSTFAAPHFEYANLPLTYNLEEGINRWIEQKCKGKYYINRSVNLIDNTLSSCLKVGFEDEKELSYFMLACPHLKYK
jgi:hypothetical protein